MGSEAYLCFSRGNDTSRSARRVSVGALLTVVVVVGVEAVVVLVVLVGVVAWIKNTPPYLPPGIRYSLVLCLMCVGEEFVLCFLLVIVLFS